MPQTLSQNSEWLKWFPDEKEREVWTHRLANLVLLDRRKNSAAANDSFSRKKEVYFKGKGTASPFILTQEVRSETKWTIDLLKQRQKRLLNALKKHWQLNDI